MTVRIVVSGSSGLVGRHVTALLRARDVALTSLVRRPESPDKLAVNYEAMVRDPAGIIAALVPQGVDVAIACLGTTVAKAGSKQAMYRVDHDYVIAFAEGARAAGARQLILMSAAGAGGSGFYLKTKGEVEEAVRKMGFERVDFIRPGLLFGERADRKLWEKVGVAIYPVFYPFLSGPFAKFRGIPVTVVAQAIVGLVDAKTSGEHAYGNTELRALGTAE